jgi:hypothetical protein
VQMAAGTNGGATVFRTYYEHGYDTILAMHIDERDLRELEQLQRPGGEPGDHRPHATRLDRNEPRDRRPGAAGTRSYRRLRSYTTVDHLEEDRLDQTPLAYGNEAERRYHLRRLDDLLEALERLNLAEAKELPAPVKARIEKEGVVVEDGTSFSRLIELVWAQQEKYLIDLKADRRKGSRRVGDGVVASHRVLDAFILGRLNLAGKRRRRMTG